MLSFDHDCITAEPLQAVGGMMKRYRIPMVLMLMLAAGTAEASMFEGETLDKVADALSWVVLVLLPMVFIYLFWMVHIMPEKIAHQRHHPQKDAIQTLCILSLFFGGLLWPLAWLWAYSKPVMYKMAYGTDKVHPEGEQAHGDDDLAVLRQENERLKAALAASQPSRGT
jgi:CBS domain containing-hemolysin-like protein